MSNSNHFKILHPLKFYRDFISRDVRPDGRMLSNFRPVIINIGSISTANGSALIKIGKTTVVCGIKAELAQPKADKPNEGYLIPNVELSPLCSPKFKPGPPSDTSQITTRFIADILDNCKCVDLNDLCISKEKLVWCLYADIICLDHDGSLIDACLLALMTALKTVKLPGVEYDSALDTKTLNKSDLKSLQVHQVPVSTTYALFEDNLIADPTSEEEDVSAGLVTIVVNDNKICSVHKPGGNPISEEKLYKAIQETIKHSISLKSLIDTAIEGEDEDHNED